MKNGNGATVVDFRGEVYWKHKYDELKALVVELESSIELSAQDLAHDLAGRDQMKQEARRRSTAQMTIELMKPAASRTTEVRTKSNSLVITTSLLVVPAAVRKIFEALP